MKKKILIAIGILFVLLAAFMIITAPPRKNSSGEQPLITSNFVDLKHIDAITKFRSCEGHLVVPQSGEEPRSNMKHYFYLKKESTKAQNMVFLYAPFDGKVTGIKGFGNTEGRQENSKDMTLSSGAMGSWGFMFLHIVPKEGLKKGSQVKSGELVGYSALDVPPLFSFDVIYGKTGIFPKKVDNWMNPYANLDSVFNHMTDEVLAQYNSLGVNKKEDAVNSKEYRENNPCTYEGTGPRFGRSDNEKVQKLDWIGSVWD